MHMQLEAGYAEERRAWAQERASWAARFDSERASWAARFDSERVSWAARFDREAARCNRERAIVENLQIEHMKVAIKSTELDGRLQSMTASFIKGVRTWNLLMDLLLESS